ncbi:diguanylate phosphodiesterase [Paraburkholderia caffeinilytica]|uniref:Bifunctional diguanylate cyclase/phosphodiesterase n=1 Tax=Paraburkholderia caffeinilytica TaxID=1761016 RepID=A0ABQ1MI54_9BURK|nr:EAL domain-containing protein [Paraburkholderia caffeinilytica]AXL49981.1 diguanylate phosphodiesterase [Paraburkholderia caffeinilytica]GGC39406.1 bifunctional diguanylate cyclase/phosphodiesterase [Paraburkholderia caffeinilytica]CAB3786615.1 putative signaling protein [Paraburkholderia caffeinilytica]
MQSSYNFWLVAISFAVAALASYTALDLTGRIFLLASARQRHAWRLGGAAALGVGIWSMHFVAMLAFSLPIPLGYDFSTTAYSLGLAIGASYLALIVTTQARLTPLRLIAGGVLMGFGIAGMHYTGMAAMQMEPGIHYQPAWFAASLAIAIGASTAALWMARALSNDGEHHVLRKRFIAALVMGVAISGMHYAGMAAAEFPAGAVCGAAKGVNAAWLATSVILFTFAILIVTLILSRFDARTSFLVSAVSKLNGQIVRLATLDTLTGLPNRSTLTERIDRAIHSARRRRSLFAILFMDLDGFKTINDSLGHSAGDEVLSAFAQRLLQCVRASDTVARLGGDEFVVLSENLASREDAGTMAEDVLDRMRQGVWADSQPLQVMPSIGIALFPYDGDTVETLLKHADAAMYEAKRAGRGTYRFFEQSMKEAAMRTLQIQSALHEALTTGHFSLHFQPKFHGSGDSLAGAEALIRLHHPQLGTLTPLEFIPIAERSGQIVQIGYWVLRETCRQIRRWVEQGLPLMKVAINLSPRQLSQPNLVATMLDIVQAEGVQCAQIMFEITETVAMQDAPKTIEMIREFQASGFEIAIDDFGTGYSSLAYLQRFRVKQLKIDRFFTNGLDEHGPEGSAIVSAIIALAHSLDMDVVAEGVETESQLGKLKSMMCDEMQGFLLGKPLTADDFGEMLRARTVTA